MERRPTKKFKRRENKKFPYKKHRTKSCIYVSKYEHQLKKKLKSPMNIKNKLKKVAPFVEIKNNGN